MLWIRIRLSILMLIQIWIRILSPGLHMLEYLTYFIQSIASLHCLIFLFIITGVMIFKTLDSIFKFFK